MVGDAIVGGKLILPLSEQRMASVGWSGVNHKEETHEICCNCDDGGRAGGI